ncbi:hypothetical protein HAX54_023660 [Datura stramonium]|uniref:Uncharacterized protein n=1 Tax=Datura stramonium TaxID=4076 RepID=A0ABS8UY63_DATST|nr:hypothetical protein [Datura stramonium]
MYQTAMPRHWAPPKSVLKSNGCERSYFSSCQKAIYRWHCTVKTTDKPAVSSGQLDGSGEDDLTTIGSTGGGDRAGLCRFMDQRGGSDGSFQPEPDYPSTATPTLWSNSSSNREGWLCHNSNDANGLRSHCFPSQQRSGHHIEECNPSRPKSQQFGNSSEKSKFGVHIRKTRLD